MSVPSLLRNYRLTINDAEYFTLLNSLCFLCSSSASRIKLTTLLQTSVSFLHNRTDTALRQVSDPATLKVVQW